MDARFKIVYGSNIVYNHKNAAFSKDKAGNPDLSQQL